MTIGALSAAILLVSRAMAPVATATALAFRMVQSLRQAASVAPLLDSPLETASDPSLATRGPIEGEIAARALSFTYPGETRPALKELAFSIRPGERVGVIGRAGCGKSTLLRLMVRLHDAQAGGLMLDGRDIRQRDPGELRETIGYLPQDTHLIDGTVEANLTLGLPESRLDRDRLRRIARLCGVEAFVSQHPAGYGLPVGPGGKRLSGGERQAVALARALIQPARLYLLDEPTAAFDTNAENQLVRELAAHIGGAGLIVATHRLPLLGLVDRIIWLDGGRIVADGPKAEVFARLGLPHAA
jgi:ATP-binding cassette subfamily C protein LapB